MKSAYVDTSILVAALLDEQAAVRARAMLRKFKRLVSAALLEAELKSCLAREGIALGEAETALSGVELIFPDRPLGTEIAAVLQAGYVRGADLWHLANALFVSPRAHQLPFLTFDNRQRAVAAALGFPAS